MKRLVSGAIGSGKSTAVRGAMHRLDWRNPAGFFTHWGGAGRGARTLMLETWDGHVVPIAHRVAQPAVPGGLPYELDGPAFAGAAIASLLPAAAGHPVVIDELGLMEWDSAEFIHALVEVFRGPAPVLAVIQQRALDRWRALLDADAAAPLLLVEPATRDTLPERIAAQFRRA